jgi:tol-pal system protein YbgF
LSLQRSRRRAPAAARLLAAAVVLGGGCKRSYDRAAVQVDEIRTEVDSLEAGQRRLHLAIRNVERVLESEMAVLRRQRADQSTAVVELHDRLGVLEGKLEDQSYRMERFLGRLEPSRPGPATGGPGPAVADTAAGGARAPRPAADSLSTGGEVPRRAPGDLQALYDSAYLDVTRGNYGLALMGFEQFLETSPESELADNARYWIGECFYAQGKYIEALAEFRRVVEDYPDGSKVPAALLKIGLTYAQLGQDDKARIFFERVSAEHPNSEEAAAARARLTSGP